MRHGRQEITKSVETPRRDRQASAGAGPAVSHRAEGGSGSALAGDDDGGILAGHTMRFIGDDDDYVQDNQTLRSADGLGRIWLELGATHQSYSQIYTSY